jgi:pilus assembly protein CpaF
MSDLRQKAKVFAHKNLLEMFDLRRTSYEELKGPALKHRVEAIVRECLSKFEGGAFSRNEELELVQEIVAEAVGLGPLEAFLSDPTITEVMVNGPDSIFVEQGGKIRETDARFVHAASLRAIIDRIVSPLGRRIDEASPMVDARLKDGSRVNVIIPPLALNGPTITIRKFSKVPLSIEKLIQFKSLTAQSVYFLREAVRQRKNVLIAGGTGSGKTTLLNAISAFIPSSDRIITIEDAAELKLPQKHVISLEARPSNIEGKGEIGIRDLVRNALRMRPDRIVVGECRGGEALDMLQAMNTGHDGSLTTLHANSPRDALLRVETMVMMAGFDLPLKAIREQMASAIDLILFQARSHDGQRSVTHITEVCGTENGTIVTQDLFAKESPDHPIRSTGRVPKFLDKLPAEARTKFLQIAAMEKEAA